MTFPRAALTLLILSLVPALFAAEVAHWSPDAGSATREFRRSTGELRAWDWAGGVKLFDKQNNREFIIPRDSIIGVSRETSDRSPQLESAIQRRDIAALTQISTGGRDDIEKEEALWTIAHVRSLTGGQPGATALREYLRAFPRGNFALEARIRLANITAFFQGATPAQQAEANKLFDEAAALGGEIARAAGNLRAGELALLHSSNGAAADKLAAAVDAAGKVKHREYQIRALVAHGRALSLASKVEDARRAFTAALGVPMDSEYSYADMKKGRGEAHIGLAKLGGKTRAGYDAWISASCWFSGTATEAECLISALDIAEELAATDPTQWADRSKELRASIERAYRGELQAHDRRKAAAAGGR